ncbi:PEGA domain-containing protein, partial [Patescibacteria group bacterium]|nr:PEGA domain-containing protein [Patescibacteria group bacterium]
MKYVKKIMLRIIGQVLSISIFIGIFLLSLFITYGYRYDFEENEVIQTSVIDVCTVPKKADLYLDGEFRSDRACDKIFGLDLGAHALEIQKDGYYEWTKNIYLDNQNVSLYPQIFLVPYPDFYTTTVLENNADQVWIAPNQSKYLVYDRSYDILKVYSVSGSTPLIWEVPYIIENLVWENNSVIVADTSGGRYQMNVNKGNWE